MTDVIIFGGTTEGRTLSETLAERGLKVNVCVATEYGGSVIRKNGNIEISDERLGGVAGIKALIKRKKVSVVVDATHPYAVTMSGNIKKACEECGAERIRLVRAGSGPSGNVTTVGCIDEAVELLKRTEGNVLVTTGSKELAKYTSIENFKERVFARVLSLPEVAEQCAKVGFRGRNLICMQGPFNEDINYGMMKQFGIEHMVTKDSGDTGGFDEKMKAAERAGVNVIIVGRPPEKGMTYDAVVKEMIKRFNLKDKKAGVPKKKNLWMIGIGMGGPEGMTIEAAEACRNADVVIGPKRMTDAAGAKNAFNEFRPEKIIPFLHEHPEYGNIAFVFSGDIGFYSGAKKMIENADPDWNIVPICGISSVVYLCGKLMMPWQDAHLMSAHGLEVNTVGEIRRNKKVFSLLSKGTDINELCKKLITYGMEKVELIAAEKLGYPDEKITKGYPRELIDKKFDDLSVILAINDSFDNGCPIGIPDEEFVRGDVPMTKSEIRTLTVAKLKLKDDSVAYDVGAGTGSVSIEMARAAVNGKVYAIEMEEDALELIAKNKIRFAADNLEIVGGKAPAAMKKLPAPTHAFIGGSSGNLKKILKALTEKNPNIRVVINSVTIETVGETMRCIKELGLKEIETLCVSVSRSRTTEKVHLMTAQNPIYITVCEGLK